MMSALCGLNAMAMIGKTVILTVTATETIEIQIESGGGQGRNEKTRETRSVTETEMIAVGSAIERSLEIVTFRQWRVVRCLRLNRRILRSLAHLMRLLLLFTTLVLISSFLASFRIPLLNRIARPILLVKQPIIMVTRDSLSRNSRASDQSPRWLYLIVNRI